jgi:hypothetical protein
MRLVAAICLIAVVGCGSADNGAAPGDTSTTTTIPDLPEGLSTTTYRGIVADAADRAGVEETEVDLVSIEDEQFSDMSLGCPEEGQMYAQVITSGFRVLVSAAGVEYDYRLAEGDEGYRLCEPPG